MYLIFLFYCCGFFLSASSSSEEGEICQSEDQKGICVLVTDCPSAIALLKQRKSLIHKRCGWIGDKEIICCLDAVNKPETRGPVIRKSEKVCNEMAEDEGPTGVATQILGGEDAVPGEFPHMAAIGFDSGGQQELEWGLCGGALISDRYILTAAHCFVTPDKKEPVLVRLGKVDLLGDSDKVKSQDYEIHNVTLHQEYDIKLKTNDIALLQLKTPVSRNQNVKPACLYTQTDDPDSLIITGWGLTQSQGSGSRILQKTAIKPIDLSSCNATFYVPPFPRSIFNTQLCAKSNDTVVRDSCQGDSGGPAQVQVLRNTRIYRIVGITSYGRGCGGNFPSIYTRVSSYLNWIEEIVWP